MDEILDQEDILGYAKYFGTRLKLLTFVHWRYAMAN